MPVQLVSKTNHRTLLWMGLAILWGVMVLAGYYYIHKPVTPFEALRTGQSLLDVILALSLTGLAGGVGRRIYTAGDLNVLEQTAIQVAIGWGCLSLFWFAIGLLGLYNHWVAWLALLLGWFIFRRDGIAWFRALRILKSTWLDNGRYGKLLTIGCCILVAGQLLVALAPPLHWDTLAYHLELPRRYLAAGRFSFLTDNPLWGRSQGAEMLFTWAIALRGWETATTLSWFFGMALLIGVLGFTMRWANPEAAWVAVTALLTGYTLRSMLSWGYVDGLVALYGLSVLLLVINPGKKSKIVQAFWIGVLIGLALGVKLTTVILLPAVILSWIGPWMRSESNRVFTLLGLTLAVGGVIYAPWLLKNIQATGNPFYPNFWPAAAMTPDRLAYYQGETGQEPFSWQDAWLPIAMTWYGIEGGSVAGIDKYYADIGPLLVLLAIPGLLSKLNDRRAQVCIIWLGIGWLAMAVGGHFTALLWQTRYYFALLPVAALAAAWGWQFFAGLSAGGIRLRRVFGVLVGLALGFSVWQDVGAISRTNPAAVDLGTYPEEAYIDNALGGYGPATRALYQLPAGSRTLFLWDERGLYAPLSSQADPLIDRWFVARHTIGDPGSILSAWRASGFTHLLIYQTGMEFERQHRLQLSPGDWRALDDLLAMLPPPVDFEGEYRLYTLSQ